MENQTSSQLREIDVAAIIQSKNLGSDFLIDLDIHDSMLETAGGIVIRNGIIILLCKADSGILKVDGKEYRLSRNNLVVLPENHIIDHISPKLLQERGVIAVSVDYILNMPSPIDTNIFGYSRYISVVRIEEEKFNDLWSYYKFLHKESHEESKYKAEIIRSIFYALVLEIVAEYERLFEADTTHSIKADNLSDRFFRLLATHYKHHRTVRFYAERLHLTPKYLSTAIKRVTGRPILDWIHEAVLIDAKMLLRTTDLTVQEISEQLNFSSPSAFVQFFKKHTGTTPRRLL